MKAKSVGIKGLGYYVPERIMTNADFEKIVETSDEWITTMTGIKERHRIAPEQATSDMCFEAAKKALAAAKVKPEDLDLIIVATVTPDHHAQGAACILQKKLGLHTIPAFDISAGCSGFTYGLTLGDSLIKSGRFKRILMIAAESLTKITNYEDRSTCVLFGDGAAATVLEEVEEGYGILSSYIGAEGEDDGILSIPAGGSRKPHTVESIQNNEQYIVMKGPDVYKFAVNICPAATKKAMELAGLKMSDLDLFVPHQANIRIIEAAVKRLKIPQEKVFINIQKYGNTSAATTGIAMGEAMEQGILKKGKIVAITAFGSGLTFGSVVMKWAY
ncbi:MAG: ketoacyl-ACP synthase III [Fusobacteriaceae bacterium]|jgi:3-oxoacyl-[acyl-carrier-protein] synthase-3|nr:ketoacyl-ACP synthase III [Fusobacteriaceae bacterium]